MYIFFGCGMLCSMLNLNSQVLTKLYLILIVSLIFIIIIIIIIIIITDLF